MTHPDGTFVSSAFNDMNQVAFRINEANLITRFEYTRDGKLAWAIDPAGKRAGYQYDAEGRIEQHNSPGVANGWRSLAIYRYDLAGNLTSRTDNQASASRSSPASTGPSPTPSTPTAIGPP